MTRDDDLFPVLRGLRAIRRRGSLVVAAGLLAACLTVGVTLGLTESFSSTALVMIDTRIRPEGELTSGTGFVPASVTAIESELEVLRSKDLLERVVRRLDLMTDPRLAGDSDDARLPGPPGALADAVRGLLVGPAVGPAATPGESIDWQLEETVERLREMRTVEQVGVVSSVYAVTVEHENRLFSAELANTIASEYLALKKEQQIADLDAVYGWLFERSAELSTRLQTLERELQTLVNDPVYSSNSMLTSDIRRLAQLRDAEGGDRVEEVDAIEARLRAHGDHEAELRRVESAIEATQAAFTTIQTQIQTRRESSALSEDVRIVGEARPALEPTGPRKRMAGFVGLLLGSALAAAAIAFREIVAAPLRAPGDVRLLPGTLLYAPSVGRGAGGLRRLVRGLTGAVDARDPAGSSHVVAVTAPREEDAALAVALGLVATYDAHGKSALLVADAAHCPPAARRLQPVPSQGDAPAHFNAVRPESLTEGAAILPLDLANESVRDAVASGGLERWVERNGAAIDRIVLLVPPVLAEPDLAPVVALADVRLLVVECDRAKLDDIDVALNAMAAGRAEADILVMLSMGKRTLRRTSKRLFADRFAWETVQRPHSRPSAQEPAPAGKFHSSCNRGPHE